MIDLDSHSKKWLINWNIKIESTKNKMLNPEQQKPQNHPFIYEHELSYFDNFSKSYRFYVHHQATDAECKQAIISNSY